MPSIRLYTDEHVRAKLASVLRGRGFDAVAAHELGHRGMRDPDIFQFAISDRRAVVTYNVRHFVPLTEAAMHQGEHFFGLIVSEQFPFKETLRRLTRLLGERQAAELENSIVWLSRYG